MNISRAGFLIPLLVVALSAQSLMAGPNAGFLVAVGPQLRVDNPVVGDVITLAIRAKGTTEVKGIAVTALFDSTFLEFVSYSLGDLTPGAIALQAPVRSRDNGLAEVDGGSTILGSGSSITSGGLLGTFQFRLTSDLPEGGSGIWLTRVEVNTSASVEDKDVLTYASGELGVTLVERFANRIF